VHNPEVAFFSPSDRRRCGMLATLAAPVTGLSELSPLEAEQIGGGTAPLAYATFFLAAFEAGFVFGYTQLGPALFGE
jgi:hypothetical protein